MKIISFKKLDSTNTYSKLNIDHLDDKTIVSTDIQTAGRGRFTRPWVDLGEENIYMSIILKPSNKFELIHSNLTQYLSLVLCKQLEKMGLKPEIKWPNDVLVDGKKVSGILAEAVIKGGILKGIVLGIGINLNARHEDISLIDKPAISLNLILGENIDKNQFIPNLLVDFFKGYDEFLQNGFLSIKQDYTKRSSLLDAEGQFGEEISVAIFNLIKVGYFSGFDDDGNLLLRNNNKELEKINMGEII